MLGLFLHNGSGLSLGSGGGDASIKALGLTMCAFCVIVMKMEEINKRRQLQAASKKCASSNSTKITASKKEPTDVVSDDSDTSNACSRKVRFSPTNIYIPNDLVRCFEMDDDIKRELWWKGNEMKKFKENALILAYEIQIYDTEYNNTPLSYTNVLMKIFESCENVNNTDGDDEKVQEMLTDIDRKYLDYWVTTGSYRLGLEKITIRSNAKGSSMIRKRIISQVLEAQVTAEGDMHTLQEASTKLSRPARLFASVLGQSVAQSVAADSCENETDMATKPTAMISNYSNRKIIPSPTLVGPIPTPSIQLIHVR